MACIRLPNLTAFFPHAFEMKNNHNRPNVSVKRLVHWDVHNQTQSLLCFLKGTSNLESRILKIRN